MLKYTASSIAPSITVLFNNSIQMGRIPDQRKESMVVPIPKSTNVSELGHYRSIFLPPANSATLGEAHRHVLFMNICSPSITCPTISGVFMKTEQQV